MGRAASSPADLKALETKVRATIVRELLSAFRQANSNLFGGALKTPVLTLVDDRERHGYWLSGTRTLAISLRLTLEYPWGETIDVLHHEMAHQYVDEVLTVRDETAHGPAFQRVCADRGIMAAARHTPNGDGTEHPVIDRVRKLLALAGSQNEHEAQVAMRHAQRLMLKHNLASVGTRVGYTHRALPPIKRVDHHYRALATILTKHFFVDAIWLDTFLPQEGRGGKSLEVLGALENVEMAAYVWDFLVNAAETMWRTYKQRHGAHGSERRAYLLGCMRGFLAKLNEQKDENTGAGLVWVGDPGLADFFAKRHPHVVRVNYRSRTQNHGAYRSGAAAGRTITLHRPVGAGPSTGGPLLLAGRRA